MTRLIQLVAAATLLGTIACAGGDAGPDGGQTPAAPTSTPTASTAGEPQTPDAGGSIITVEMITDDQGNNVYRPAQIDAKPGDVVRFTLLTGVHNVNFLPDSNPGVQGLPPAGDLLQLPGQTWDYKVTAAPGRYYFHCDPHALLGMIGHLNVTAR